MAGNTPPGESFTSPVDGVSAEMWRNAVPPMLETIGHGGALGYAMGLDRTSTRDFQLGQHDSRYHAYWETFREVHNSLDHGTNLFIQADQHTGAAKTFNLHQYLALAGDKDFNLLRLPKAQRKRLVEVLLMSNGFCGPADSYCMENEMRFVSFAGYPGMAQTSINDEAWVGNHIRKFVVNCLVILLHVDNEEWDKGLYRFAAMCVYAQTCGTQVPVGQYKLSVMDAFFLQLRQLPEEPAAFSKLLLERLADPTPQSALNFNSLLKAEADMTKFDFNGMKTALDKLLSDQQMVAALNAALADFEHLQLAAGDGQAPGAAQVIPGAQHLSQSSEEEEEE